MERKLKMNKAFNFFEDIKGKNIDVVGVGVSNLPLIELLTKKGATVCAYDKKTTDQLGENYEKLKELNVSFVGGDSYLDHLNGDIIFKTPGMRHDLPQLEEARARGAVVTSEMEVFFKICPCKIIAITGSDGKTTTTSIIYEMLKKEGYTCHLGGNIGAPLLPIIDEIEEGDIAVLELSSFQLHTMKNSPDVAVITNITPNHLDMHKSMAEYIDAKANIIRYQTTKNRAVFNLDNQITAKMSGDAKGEVLTFSTKHRVENGFYFEGGKIVCGLNGKTIMDTSDIKIVGMHNVENYMAAMCALYKMVSPQNMVAVAKEFAGVEHRIEFVRELNGVKYYNDSIASSPTRTVAGLTAFNKKVILIAGGYDKKIPFDDFAPDVVKKVKTLILTGHTAQKIEDAVKGCKDYSEGTPKIIRCETLKDGVMAAYREGVEGDIVTLSPACASFDAFKDFMERGKIFKSFVRDLGE